MKKYISANSLLFDSFKLAKKIFDSGYRPTYLIALWRGGTPPGIAVHEFFRFRGIDIKHNALKAQSYVGIENQGDVMIEGLREFFHELNSQDKILIVDDVFDTGRTIHKFIEELRKNSKAEVKVATVYFKPKKNLTQIKPDYYIHATEQWIIFPHELEGLDDSELMQKSKQLYKLLKQPGVK